MSFPTLTTMRPAAPMFAGKKKPLTDAEKAEILKYAKRRAEFVKTELADVDVDAQNKQLTDAAIEMAKTLAKKRAKIQKSKKWDIIAGASGVGTPYVIFKHGAHIHKAKQLGLSKWLMAAMLGVMGLDMGIVAGTSVAAVATIPEEPLSAPVDVLLDLGDAIPLAYANRILLERMARKRSEKDKDIYGENFQMLDLAPIPGKVISSEIAAPEKDAVPKASNADQKNGAQPPEDGSAPQGEK